MQGHHKQTEEAGAIAPASSFEAPPSREDQPIHSIEIWPHRSMPRGGFKGILIFTAGMLTLPALPFLIHPIGWILIPFLLGTLGLLAFFIEKNYRDGARLGETLRLWPDLVTVERRDPGGRVRYWHANPYWVTTHLKPDGKVENYLTLKGGGREIELGAFLSPEERVKLRHEVDRALADARRASAP